ncbi:MAG: NusA-like transcription termination signal-binding factor [Candidatus Diapherotrites archaeon CG11_big_fil_rev_8_21_14_0_20_37_9]|nr:MAG: NusA-like transcription termination signal-binding factor [Candidatus Diapherotrites archaeon CG11_big_fil_rev_8_21_14_0_20_37_9]
MKLDQSQIQLMNGLDKIANVMPRDCFVGDNSVVFLVHEEHMKKAIGKNGATIEKISKTLNKRVELFEYTKEPEKFFEKAFYRAKIEKVEIRETKNGKIALISADNTNKRIMLQNMGRLKKIKQLAKRNYEIGEVRIR